MVTGSTSGAVRDAHRHLGRLPAWPFYGGPAVSPDTEASGTVDELLASLDAEGTERALVIPNYGVPAADVAFGLNDLCLDAGLADDRVVVGLWTSPRPQDADLTAKALSLAAEPPVRALKLSFLLGGRATDPACRPLLDDIFATAAANHLVVHVHTSPGGASDIDEVSNLVEWYGDDVAIHLVHLGGGASGHIKLIGQRFFGWIAAGKKVYTDASWAIGFAPRWLFAEIESHGIGADRILFASDEPWSDRPGELARMEAAAGDGELGRLVFRDNFDALYEKPGK